MANDGNGGNVTDPLLPTPSELKDRLIFGPPYSHSGLIDAPSQHTSPSSPATTRHGFNRSRSAPSVTVTNDLSQPDDLVFHRSSYYSNSKSTFRQTIALIIVYLTVMSVATVLYGDQALKTLPGWLLAAIWLLVSTLAVALAFFYLAKAWMDKRNRVWAKRVISESMSACDFFAADINNNGYLSTSEYVIYKLRQVDKITYEDIKLITDQFDQMDRANHGKITLSDLLENDLSTASPV
ncbi:unnamed protein product [Eruca vesicaria subsp. sativa]|uniref:EF-hand domain-containing protein n=1 Tax=Eruca vesicaria subsp. sativa TaxID=29727 RepID=A0ABC8LJA4_ERUVS|nr:unnamed protein product [Eruca vesicaria subsp. sativa]